MTFTICIPRVNRDIKKDKIKSVFNKYNFGDLYKIVILENTHYNKVFIHYKALYNNEKTQQILKILDENNYFNIHVNLSNHSKKRDFFLLRRKRCRGKWKDKDYSEYSYS